MATVRENDDRTSEKKGKSFIAEKKTSSSVNPAAVRRWQSCPANMHRAYQPITPANNKLLKRRWDMSRYDTHRRKVHHAAAVIDNKPPQTYMHLHLKLKKLQIEEERLATVERDNRILLEKMSYIMRTRGRVDNKNDYENKSLNKTRRQRELLRVTHENQAILKRITSKEPHYNHMQWEDEWRINERYMDNISKYPKDWYKQIVRNTRPKRKTAQSAQDGAESEAQSKGGQSQEENE